MEPLNAQTNGVHTEMVIHEKRYVRRGHTESSAKVGGVSYKMGLYTEKITHRAGYGYRIFFSRTESLYIYVEVREETATHRFRSQENFTQTGHESG